MKMLKDVLVVCGILGALGITSAAYADQKDLDREKAEYVAVFSGNSLDQMRQTAISMESKGLSDPAIFDVIENRVKEKYQTSDKKELDAVAWLIKALGFSGNEKYLSTINMVAAEGNEKLKRHATNAAEQLKVFAARNAIISKNLVSAPAGQLNQQRILNQLQSGDSALIRLGVREVHDHYASGSEMDKNLLDEVKKLLLANLDIDSSDSDLEDAVAWMCKTMGATGDEGYKAILDEVILKSSNAKIRKYAAKSL